MSASPLLTLARALLADGEWHNGGELLTALARTVAPGQATRAVETGQRQHGISEEHIASVGEAEKVERGQHARAREALSCAIRRGVLVADPATVTRPCWQGQVHWRIRDPMAKTSSIAEVAAKLGLEENVPRTWIGRGVVPAPVTSPGGKIRIPDEHLGVYERVAAAYVRGGRWTTDPHTLWGEFTPAPVPGPAPLLARCPHCDGELAVQLTRPDADAIVQLVTTDEPGCGGDTGDGRRRSVTPGEGVPV